MIGRNKYRNIGSFKDFSERGKDTDTYKPLLNGYTKKVKEEIVLQLKERKKLSQTDAEDFLVNLFSLGDKRLNEIKDIISDSFSKDKNAKLCAETLISKYYGITRINKYDDPYTHEEVTEIQESLLNNLEGPNEDEILKNLSNMDPTEALFKCVKSNFGFYNGAKLAIEYGADINSKDSYDLTPFDYSFNNGFFDIVELLFINNVKLKIRYEDIFFYIEKILIRTIDNKELGFRLFKHILNKTKYISLEDIDKILNLKNLKNEKINNYLIDFKKNIKEYIENYINKTL